jgi:hypothetical protein
MRRMLMVALFVLLGFVRVALLVGAARRRTPVPGR